MTVDKKPTKVGIIGCGNIAKIHLQLLLKYVDRENIAICDTDKLRLNDFSSRMDVERVYGNLNKMLTEFRPDVVHITTPPATHKDIAVKCLENGCHVLIEKPMCISTNEADEIIECAKRNNRLVCIDHMRSFDPMILQTKKILDSGRLGIITNISVCYSYDYLTRIDTDAAASWIKNLPGGSFFDLMPHLLCLLDDFLPNLRFEKRFIKKNNSGLITDLACIFSSSVGTGTLHMSLNVYPLKNYVEFECTNGILRVDFRNFLVLVRRNHGLPNAIERIVENLSIGSQMIRGSFASVWKFLWGKLDSYAGLEKIISKFLATNESPVPPERGRKLLYLTEQIFTDEEILSNSKSDDSHEELKNSDVLVTGGTGFIGRRLVNRLLDRGHKVRVLSHRDLTDEELQLLFNSSVNLIVGNIYNYKDVERACDGIRTVYHLAAAMKGDWNYHLDTTVSGTQNMLEAAGKLGVEHFIYTSTINVYDAKRYPRNGIIDESFPYENKPENRGFYSHAKLQAEQIVSNFTNESKMTISSVRPGLVYGSGGKIFPQDVGIRIGKHLVIVIGMGFRRLPLVYIDNLVDALTVIGEKAKNPDSVFNVVDKDYPTQREYIKAYRKITKEKFFVIYIPFLFVLTAFWLIEKMVYVFFRKSLSLSYKLRCIARSPRHSTQMLKEKLGWNQSISFKEGIKLTVSEN